MKIKLDENLGRTVAATLASAGHDVLTVREEGLGSSSDRALLDACSKEGRCLVTLDMDFGNPLVFEPSRFHGIAVLRLPPRIEHAHIEASVGTLLRGLENGSIEGRLWIVEPGRIREYQPET